MKNLNMFCLVIYWTQKVHNNFIFLCSIVLPPVGHSSNHEYHRWNLQDIRAVVRIFIALLRCSVDPLVISNFGIVLQEKDGPGSSVGITTGYWLDGPGSNPGEDEIFRPSRPALGPTQPPVKWVPSLSQLLKCGRVVLLTTHPLLVSLSCKRRAISLPTLWATPGL